MNIETIANTNIVADTFGNLEVNDSLPVMAFHFCDASTYEMYVSWLWRSHYPLKNSATMYVAYVDDILHPAHSGPRCPRTLRTLAKTCYGKNIDVIAIVKSVGRNLTRWQSTARMNSVYDVNTAQHDALLALAKECEHTVKVAAHGYVLVERGISENAMADAVDAYTLSAWKYAVELGADIVRFVPAGAKV